MTKPIQSAGDRAFDAQRICLAEDCLSSAQSRGYCRTHAMRIWRDGDIGPAGVRARSLDEYVSAGGAHQRCRHLWGRASQYECIGCGGKAVDWAYDGTDQTQLYGRSGSSRVFYSRYPEFYMPMCRKCHARRDRDALVIELTEYRTLKHLSGLTFDDIAIKLGVKEALDG